MESFLEWLGSNDITLDSRLEIIKSLDGSTSIKSKEEITSNKTVVKIPKQSILSKRNCTLNSRLNELPIELSDSIILSICVLHETLLESNSRWYPYLQSLPSDSVPIASLWTDEANKWIIGTDLEREINRLAINTTTLNNLYKNFVVPFLSSPSPPPYSIPPSSSLFIWSYSIVASRAFQIDSYHSVSLVPIADLFNHSDPNQVHFASDEFVCSSCGSFSECIHDHNSLPSTSISSKKDEEEAGIEILNDEDDDTTEMFTDTLISKGEEIFNSYGQLSNAGLLASYGFSLEANDNDCCTFSFEEVVNLGRQKVTHQDWKSILKLWPQDFNNSMESILINEDKSEKLYIDAEARMSIGLWVLLALSNLRNLSTKEEEKFQQLTKLFEWQELANNERSIESSENVEEIIESVINLCDSRRSLCYQPELEGFEIFNLAEDETNNSIKQAMAFTAQERILLDSVKSAWTEQLE